DVCAPVGKLAHGGRSGAMRRKVKHFETVQGQAMGRRHREHQKWKRFLSGTYPAGARTVNRMEHASSALRMEKAGYFHAGGKRIRVVNLLLAGLRVRRLKRAHLSHFKPLSRRTA